MAEGAREGKKEEGGGERESPNALTPDMTGEGVEVVWR